MRPGRHPKSAAPILRSKRCCNCRYTPHRQGFCNDGYDSRALYKQAFTGSMTKATSRLSYLGHHRPYLYVKCAGGIPASNTFPTASPPDPTSSLSLLFCHRLVYTFSTPIIHELPASLLLVVDAVMATDTMVHLASDSHVAATWKYHLRVPTARTNRYRP